MQKTMHTSHYHSKYGKNDRLKKIRASQSASQAITIVYLFSNIFYLS